MGDGVDDLPDGRGSGSAAFDYGGEDDVIGVIEESEFVYECDGGGHECVEWKGCEIEDFDENGLGGGEFV